MNAVDVGRAGAKRTVVRGGRVVAPGARPRHADIVVVGGRVLELQEPGATNDADVIDARGLVVLPGLVNAHTHSYAQLARVPFADSWLEPWMPRAMASWRGASPEAFGVAASLTAADAVRRGITTIVDHATLNLQVLDHVIEAYDRSGLRLLLAIQVADRSLAGWVPPVLSSGVVEVISAADPFPPRDRFELLDLIEAAVARVAGHPRISVMVGPAAPERCSDQLLAGLAALATQHGLPVHAHLLEVPSQRAWGDALGRLMEHGLVGATTTVAHAVLVDAFDVERLAGAQAGVVLSAFSNAALGCRTFAPVDLLRSAGVALGVGTDGYNCGGGQDVLGSARLAMVGERGRLDSHRWLTPADAWQLATSGLAEPLGQPQLGRLEPGAPADLLLVDADAAGWLDIDDPVTEAVLGGFGAGLRAVIVDGVCVPHGDPQMLMPRARELAAGLRAANSSLSLEIEAGLVPSLVQMSRNAALLPL